MKKSNGRKKIRLIPQVMLLFAAAVFAAGFITYFTQRSISDSGIRVQTEALADEVAEETLAAIREYPASDWLLSYWYNHAGELEIEYDAEYVEGTETEAKCRLLAGHCPGLQLKYASQAELDALEPEDQRLYAEIAYSWLITRLNQVKRANNVDFLFCHTE